MPAHSRGMSRIAAMMKYDDQHLHQDRCVADDLHIEGGQRRPDDRARHPQQRGAQAEDQRQQAGLPGDVQRDEGTLHERPPDHSPSMTR
jgi:hypothetical protein